MQSTTALPSDAIAEIFATAATTGMLKYSQYHRLTAALNYSLDKQDLTAIKRVLHFVRTGRIQLVSDRFPNPLAA